MRLERVDETLLIKYLLGKLTEQEQARIEDRAFADVGYMVALEGVEADLIDAYVRGELSHAERRSFEHRFMTSPGRRRKLEFAKALAMVASEEQADTRPASRQSLLDFLRGRTPVFSFATAMAAITLIAGALWLGFQNAAIRSRVRELEAERRDTAIHEQTLRREIDIQLRKQQSPASRAATLPPLVSLVFPPGLTRSDNARPHVTLTSAMRVAHIEIQLEPRDDYQRFRIELRTVTGEQVLTQSNVPRQKTRAGFSVSFDLPVSALHAGEYELALKGVFRDTSTGDVGYYYFSVITP